MLRSDTLFPLSVIGDCIKRPPVICDLFANVPWRVAYDSLDCIITSCVSTSAHLLGYICFKQIFVVLVKAKRNMVIIFFCHPLIHLSVNLSCFAFAGTVCFLWIPSLVTYLKTIFSFVGEISIYQLLEPLLYRYRGGNEGDLHQPSHVDTVLRLSGWHGKGMYHISQGTVFSIHKPSHVDAVLRISGWHGKGMYYISQSAVFSI